MGARRHGRTREGTESAIPPRRGSVRDLTLAGSLTTANAWGLGRALQIGKLYRVDTHPQVVNGAWTREKAQAEFIKSWDTNKDNRIEKDEFFNYFEWVSAGIDSDDYFELVIRNVRHTR